MCDKYIIKWQCFILMLILKAQFGHLNKYKVVFLKHNKTTSHDTRPLMEEENSDFIDNTNYTCIARSKKFNRELKAFKIKSRIVGGFEVDDIRSFPYHASYGEYCGAAIIHKRWVITVAHCGEEWYIVAGTKNLYEGEMVDVKKHFVHPKWERPYRSKKHYFDYDFQLIKLKHSLDFNPRIRAIKFGNFSNLQAGDFLTVTGWGSLEYEGSRPDALQAVRVPVVNKDVCQRVKNPMFRHLTPRMFCAGYKEGKRDACEGDSGGAAAHNNRLIGLVSFGIECATPDAYGVYSDVSGISSWIRRTTGIYFRF